jgi:hypothetical protein
MILYRMYEICTSVHIQYTVYTAYRPQASASGPHEFIEDRSMRRTFWGRGVALKLLINEKRDGLNVASIERSR